MRLGLGSIVGALVAAALLWTIVGYFRTGPQSGVGPSGFAGAMAQSYPAQRLDGAPDSLERYRGKVLLLNMWASWCEPCRRETPALEQLARHEAARGLRVVGVNQGESRSIAAAFARAHSLTYTIWIDEGQRYGHAYAAVGLPTSLLIDRSGHIARAFDGELTLEQMRAAVEPMLSHR